MRKISFFVYGVMSHLLFLATYAYMAAFVGDFPIWKSVSGPAAGPPALALAANFGLMMAFGLQHSVMARPAFKSVWTRIVPPAIERSTYVLISNFAMLAILILWRPMGAVVWDVENETGRILLQGLFGAGWLMVPAVSLLINHFDLFGTRQVWLHLRGREYTQLPFRTPGIYRRIRHPLYVGWMLAFWATPTMTTGHLLFASVFTLYMVIAIPFEERDLIRTLGEDYRAYREQVPALIPRPGMTATGGEPTLEDVPSAA
jgi:protein-S-isoprenylcysteine O-methyltransferase Ste14